MTAFELGTLLVQAVGWSLVHFVWQAALVGVLYAVVRSLVPRGNMRYLAAMLALVVLAVLPAWTVWHVTQVIAPPTTPESGAVVAAVGGPVAAVADVARSPGWGLLFAGALPWLVLAWACGVALLGARVFRQWRRLRALVQAATTSPVWQARAEQLGARMGLRRALRVLVSVRLATPTLVGWIRPVVVVPVAMLSRLPVEQVDLILAHELAHLRRLDHLANLFQVVLETVLFYHPVVHWISRDARNERELCCDALALQATGGQRRDFVAALAGLEELRSEHAELALAASGGVLAERAWFIAGGAPPQQRSHAGLNATLVALLGAAIALGVAWQQHADRARINDIMAANTSALRNLLAMAPLSVTVPVLPRIRPALAPVAPARNVTPPQPAAPRSLALEPTVTAPRVSSVMLVPTSAIAMELPAIVPAMATGDAPPAVVARAPRALHEVSPVYPPEALESGLQGDVEVRFTLDAAGSPRDLEVVHSSAAGQFDAAALQALSQWRFAPPAEVGRSYRQAFTFRLGAAGGRGGATGCTVRTGTHICRPVGDGQPGLRARRAY